MKSIFQHSYDDIISLDNLLLAWNEFLPGKRNKKDVQEFSLRLMDNIISLQTDLKNRVYQHGGYESFFVNDPKRRHIHKASVRDRLLHHAVYRQLYPFFDKTFIIDSFSCRKDKGLHRALCRFKTVAFEASQNNTKTCWILKCDIRKFFASIDHQMLLEILKQYILDKDILWLLGNIIGSFCSCYSRESGNPAVWIPSASWRTVGDDNMKKGLPLGNLTSQLFANIYLNVFDQFVKHQLKIKYYLRYADDFVVFSTDKNYLQNLVPQIQLFLLDKLKLTLHPDKLFLKTLFSGMDFLGWVHFPHHRTLRIKTKKRMFRRVLVNPTKETLQSYLGLLKWGNGFKIREDLIDFLN